MTCLMQMMSDRVTGGGESHSEGGGGHTGGEGPPSCGAEPALEVLPRYWTATISNSVDDVRQ